MPVTLEELLAGRTLTDLSQEDLNALIIQIRQQRRAIRTPAPKKTKTAAKKKEMPNRQMLLDFIAEQTKLIGENHD